MFYLRDFLASKIFKGYADLDQYRSPDWNYHYRDQGYDEKYVYCTVEKQRPKEERLWWSPTYLSYEKCTLGKYLKKAYNKLTPAQITHVCERYKAVFLKARQDNFKIIEGDAIKDAYYRLNYVPGHGTLNNSCMRKLQCQRGNYFEIYADIGKMLILTPKRGKRIMGRALIWKYKDTYLMDRVYTCESYIDTLFIEYAKEHGWGYLVKNTYVCGHGDIQKWYLPEDNYKEPHSVKLEIPLNKEYNKFPYVDSMCYLNSDENTISTYPTKKWSYVLHSIYGYKTYCQMHYYEEN